MMNKSTLSRLSSLVLPGALIIYDLLAVLGALTLALYLRFDTLPGEYVLAHLESLPVVLGLYLLTFYLFRLYRHRWQFAGLEVLWAIVWANVIATALGAIAQRLIDGSTLPRSVILLSGVLSIVFIGGQRILMRVISQYLERENTDRGSCLWDDEPKRVVILGSGQSTVEVLAALNKECAGRYEVIGILSDDPRDHGGYFRGVKILGGFPLLYDLLRLHEVDEVIIAVSNAEKIDLRDYVLACCKDKVAVRVVPVIAELLENPSASRGRLRVENIATEHLLHRQPVEITLDDTGGIIRGKRVLVTGAGGSIGSELCRRILMMQPESLVLYGHGENSLHQIIQELQHSTPNARGLEVVIGDVKDERRLRRTVERLSTKIIFHAAAHKHVPLMEENVCEAVTNNIGGTRNVIRVAAECGVERLLLISTDKAVYPSSVMGATKCLCEEMMRAEAGNNRLTCITVRFGNVLGSRGSVLPHFQRQILLGEPVTVTHPEAQRYFMTIPEAVMLVVQAVQQGESGDLFVLEMGRPIRILELAEDLIRLYGLQPYSDIPITFCGMRAGEKLDERLFTDEEAKIARDLGNMHRVQRPRCLEANALDTIVNSLLAVAEKGDDAAVMEGLRAAIPTFRQGELIGAGKR